MDTLDFNDKWDFLQGKIKQKYKDLQVEYVLFVEGKEDGFYQKLQESPGTAREEVRLS